MPIKKLKPTPEIVASEYLNGDVLNDCMNIIDFLRANKYTPRHVAKNSWEVIVENKERTHTEKQILRRLRIFNDGTWTVTLHFFPEFNDRITDDEVKNFVWSNLDHNKTICHADANGMCPHKKTMDIFGKACADMCCCCQIKITNPTGDDLNHIKTLILTAKEIIKTA